MGTRGTKKGIDIKIQAKIGTKMLLCLLSFIPLFAIMILNAVGVVDNEVANTGLIAISGLWGIYVGGKTLQNIRLSNNHGGNDDDTEDTEDITEIFYDIDPDRHDMSPEDRG